MISTKNLINKVRRLINETEDDAGVSLIDDAVRSIDDMIIELLPQAVTMVQKQCRGRFVNVKTLLPDNTILKDSSDGFRYIVLPNDFVELVSVRLESWRTPCIKAVSPASVEMLYKSDKSLSAVSRRPMCAEDVTADGVRIIKLFPAGNSDRIDHFVYEAQFDATKGLNTSDSRMIDAVLYVCTALLYNLFERYDAAKSFMSLAAAMYDDDVK